MSYRDFKLSDIKKIFHLKIHDKTNLFVEVAESVISDFLAQTLARSTDLALAVNTEKARSEFIIAPILNEIRILKNRQISLFSGIELDVDSSQGLNGFCDFIISGSSEQILLSAPLVAIVEAKNDNISDHLGQCVAEMIAARIFNENENNGITQIYGIVTTGSLWRFLKLKDQTVYVDIEEYHVKNINKLLGILLNIVS